MCARKKSQTAPREDFNGFILPRSLMREIQEALIERRELGYLDIGEFIRDALRRRIEQLEKYDREAG